MNRRDFFKENIKSSIGFLAEFFTASMEKEVQFLRPPGTVDEWEFLTSCTRCGICHEACPEEIISLFSSSSGAKLTGTPYVDVMKSPCTFCNRCVDACPTEALSHSSTPFQIGVAKIIPNNCLTFEGILCDYCVRGCPENAISFADTGTPVIDGSLCNGCGVCVKDCIEDTKGIKVIPI